MEEGVLAFWKKIDAFRTSLKQSEGKPEFSFYDGPPFATGMPHYGHILAGTIKVCSSSKRQRVGSRKQRKQEKARESKQRKKASGGLVRY